MAGKSTVITSSPPSLRQQLREVWEYRELLLMLAYRDFRVKYAQAFLGFSWAILNPLINLVLLSFVFHAVAGVDTDEVPPLLFTIVGLSGWTYFSEVFSSAGESILGAQQMVKKIYFPRLILPLSKALTALIDLCVVLLLTLVLLGVYGFSPGVEMLFLPLAILLAMLAGLCGGILLSALTIRYRDFKYISPTLLRVGLFISPIAYSAAQVPEAYVPLYYLNPLAGTIELMRWSLLGTSAPPLYALSGIALLGLGFWASIVYFNKVESTIADIL